MSAYAVNIRAPGALTGYRVTVDRSGSPNYPRGTGYGSTEREAIRRAWLDYWRQTRLTKS